MCKIATFKSDWLCILALIVVVICASLFGFLFQFLGFFLQFAGPSLQFLDPTVGVGIGVIVGLAIGLPIAFSDKIRQKTREHKIKTALEQQTKFICPRCKILVDKNPGICPQCNQKI